MSVTEKGSAISAMAPKLVMQFLHAGVQLVGQLHEIHSFQNDEQTVKEWDLCDLNTQLTTLNDSIAGGCPREIGPLSEQDQSLENLCATSCLILETVLCRLELIQTFGPGSILHVGELKMLWPREDVEGLEERIISFKLELEVAISSIQGSVTEREALLSLDTTRSKRAFKKPLVPDLRREGSDKSSKPSVVTVFGKEATGKQNGVAYEGFDQAYTEETLFTDHETTIQDFLLETIKLSSMTDRENSVTVAHNKTFDWIFLPNESSPAIQGWQARNSFISWLKDSHNQHGIYWVSGKAGSGKSTLMRYVMHHAETVSLLRSWAQNKRLITAGFYFWISGTLEQRSQTGLIRHILTQLLEQQRHLIPMVFPERWKALLSLSTRERVKASISWDLPELTSALKSFLEHAGCGSKVCLFIDGLDEFAGDHQQIVEFFKDCVASYPHVKVCLSSRPLPIFRAAFGKNPKLELHELTRKDMLHFVRDHLSEDPTISQALVRDEKAASQLIESIVDKADGVFLWVMLVVQSLLRRGNYATVRQMHEYLNQYPSDLDDLFTHFLFKAASTDQTLIMSRLLQLLQARQDVCYATRQQDAVSMSLWDFALADQFEELVTNIPKDVQRASEKTIIRICEVTKARMFNECAGLIVTHASGLSTSMLRRSTPSPAQQLSHSKISYVHRTVKDFLSLSRVWSRILEPTIGSDFEPHTSLLTSIILQFKWPLDEFHPNRQINDWWPNILLTLLMHDCPRIISSRS